MANEGKITVKGRNGWPGREGGSGGGGGGGGCNAGELNTADKPMMGTLTTDFFLDLQTG